MRFAIIENGVVVNIAAADTDHADPDVAAAAQAFVAEHGWHQVGAEVAIGDHFDGAAFSKPPRPTLELRKAALLEALAERRYQAEIAGTMLGGVPIATDRETQGKLTSAYLKAKGSAAYAIPNWKVAPGAFVTLDAATIIAAGDAAAAHVQACFDREAELSAAIAAAADDAELEAVDIGAGWP